MILLRLFFEFSKVGLFSVGGGLATLPFLYDLSDNTGWFSHTDLTNMLAVSESTPGPIGVNTATYVGFTVAGLPGAILATLGLIFPSIIVVLVIAKILARFKENAVVGSVFYGLRPASAGLIAAAGFSVFQITLLSFERFQATGNPLLFFRWENILIAVILFFLTRRFTKLHPVVFIAATAALGILLKLE